jgi:hypothetical protein
MLSGDKAAISDEAVVEPAAAPPFLQDRPVSRYRGVPVVALKIVLGIGAFILVLLTVRAWRNRLS